jgi:hypothetical protein
MILLLLRKLKKSWLLGLVLLKSLAAVQVTKKPLAASQIHHVPTAGVSGTYLCDVMYLKDSTGKTQKRSSFFLVVHVGTCIPVKCIFGTVKRIFGSVKVRNVRESI